VDTSVGINGSSIYGNNFANMSIAEIQERTLLINDQVAATHNLSLFSNLICIEAPKDGSGEYTSEQIEYILSCAYTGFTAAKSLGKGKKVCIHTGNWGCGAYGGNLRLMAIIQIIAARMARVDRLVYYPMNYSTELDGAIRWLSKRWHDGQTLQLKEILKTLFDMKYEWGVGNNT